MERHTAVLVLTRTVRATASAPFPATDATRLACAAFHNAKWISNAGSTLEPRWISKSGGATDKLGVLAGERLGTALKIFIGNMFGGPLAGVLGGALGAL